MKRVRGGSGLGDALYLRAIVEHLLRRGESVTVCCGYPEVFSGLDVRLEPFNRNGINVLAHYTLGKTNTNTNQWQDICLSAGFSAALKFNWQVKNVPLVVSLRAKAKGRPIVLVHGGRTPMARTDGFGRELLPTQSAFDMVLSQFPDCMLVQIGNDRQIYPLQTEINLNRETSVSDLIDLGSICDAIIGQCSFVIPLAEVFDKPLLIVWAAAGMSPARHQYISSITPKKILSKPTSTFVMDDWPTGKLQDGARAFRNSL